MTARLERICRHPVKSIGYEELAEVTLTEGRPLPFDRLWAVAHAAATFEGQPDAWQPKMNFLRGVAGPQLMAVRAQLGEDGLMLTHPARPALRFAPGRDPDALLLDWLAPLWPEGRPAPARVVRAAGGALADCPEPFVALANRASNRALGQRLGRDLNPHRWRANLWLDGLAPWEEFDLIGAEIAIGAARLRIECRITRCKATCANPETGVVDTDTLGALEDGYGHHDFGVYAVVTAGGAIRAGDPVSW